MKIAAHAEWQDACRSYAREFTQSAIAAGTLADRVRLGDSYVMKILGPTEVVLRKLVAAGFDHETAMRTLALLTNICLAYARDIVVVSRSGVTLRPAILRKALEQRDPKHFKTLAQIAKLGAITYDEAQLELSINVFIFGAETLLERVRAKCVRRRRKNQPGSV
jgi:hypothetical protein